MGEIPVGPLQPPKLPDIGLEGAGFIDTGRFWRSP